MRNTIRLSVAAAAMFVILPAWADGASVVDRQDAQLAELRGENPALPEYVARVRAPAEVDSQTGSAGSEPGDTSLDQEHSPAPAN